MNKIQSIRLIQFPDVNWTYDLYLYMGNKLPQRGKLYPSPEDALTAAKIEASEYIPPPPGPTWEERLAALKKRFGI